MKILDTIHKGFNLDNPPTNSFLFAFDFDPPKLAETTGSILFIHSSPVEISQIHLSRLMDLYPKAKFIVLQKEGVSYSKKFSTRISFQKYYKSSIDEKNLTGHKVDLIFFGVNFTCYYNVNKFEKYKNIIECLEKQGYENSSYGIDEVHMTYPLSSFLCHTKPWEVNQTTLHLPPTFMFKEEIEALFQLSENNDLNGAIVNLGHFLGGTAITMAKGSKLRKKDKVYSFDNVLYNWTTDIWKKNQVEDWIIFKQMESKDAATEWGKRNNTEISLLFIDTDHSYGACTKDILNWSSYLSTGGTIVIHDYPSPGVRRAVYDHISSNPNYSDFRQIGLTFIAKKIS